MSNLIIDKATIHRGTCLWFILVALLTFNISCNRQPSDRQVYDPRLPILEEQTRMLMILEAQQGFGELFKASFNPDKTQLLLGADLQKWFQENKKSMDLVPDEIRASIRNNRGAGLLIRDVPGAKGGTHDVVYLRPPRFGIRRFFVTRDPDPCGDGNPATCERCVGCSGESSAGGIIKSCLCLEACECRTCPTC